MSTYVNAPRGVEAFGKSHWFLALPILHWLDATDRALFYAVDNVLLAGRYPVAIQ